MSSLTVQSGAILDVVPRAYVHKAAQSEVLLTGFEPLGGDIFTITAQWPRCHGFYDVVNGQHDPLLVTETIRQTIPLLSHLGYGAPLGHRQIWDHVDWTIDPQGLADTDSPADIRMRVACSEVVRRGTRLVSARMRVDLSRGDAPLGSATTRFANLPPATYARLRGDYADLGRAHAQAIALAPPLAPCRVARARFRDVVLSPSDDPLHFQLRVDLNHPVLFDHPVDHAPGMLVLEAARQATHAALHPDFAVITGMEAVFHRYVEVDAPCWISVEPLAAGSGPGSRAVCRVTATQREQTMFSALVNAVRAPAAAL